MHMKTCVEPGMVVHAYNPSYLGDRHKRIESLRLAWTT
jgi:hypothetical protein